ncbi:MAG TPA: RIP metalloprotease RseP [Thermodesulfobacteriota bacterium]
MPEFMAAISVGAVGGVLEKLLLIVFVLGALIFVHELGHFLLAKWSGVGVLKFSLGFGPTLFGRRIGETEYVVSLIPLGGYVKMVGEGDGPGQGGAEFSEADRQRAFSEQSVWKRFLIVFAGPGFNLLTAVVLLTAAAAVFGLPVPTERPIVGEVVETRPPEAPSPAQEAGLRSGDRVVSVNGVPVASWEEMAKAINASGGQPIALVVAREGEGERTLTVHPREEAVRDIFGEPVAGGERRFVIGIRPAPEYQEVSLLESVQVGAIEAWRMTALTVEALVRLVQGRISASTIGGPLLIGEQTIRHAEQGAVALLRFMALLSVNLGVLNLLPVPVLDGGHLLFFVVEMVTRRPVSLRTREIAQHVGLMMLLLLMGFAIFNDIRRWL